MPASSLLTGDVGRTRKEAAENRGTVHDNGRRGFLSSRGLTGCTVPGRDRGRRRQHHVRVHGPQRCLRHQRLPRRRRLPGYAAAATSTRKQNWPRGTNRLETPARPEIRAYLGERRWKGGTSMPRAIGDRYVCDKCGAELVYSKPCDCPEGKPHSEICCGQQMRLGKE